MDIEFFYRNEAKKISQIPDWSENAVASDHLWMPTSISGDLCNVGDSECTVRLFYIYMLLLLFFKRTSFEKRKLSLNQRCKFFLYYHLMFYFHCLSQRRGPRMKCSACKMIAHINCITIVSSRPQLSCKPSFIDVSLRQYREQRTTQHHWIHRRTEKGKCKQCGKVRVMFMSKNKLCMTYFNCSIKCF